MQSQCLLLCFLALVICQGTETVLDLFPEYKIGQRRIDALENDNKALKVEIAQIKDGGPAFTVSLTTGEPRITGNVPIKFNHVILNRRSGYDPSTGYFTVPLTGLYQISATIMSRNNGPFHASLNKNGHDIVLLYGTEINGANESANVVVELTKGDKVCVKHSGSGTEVIHGYGYCYFSGYYISK
ncbi:collagen alpha-1(X) chain-like isoform X2 [Mytilus trossulus]|uniref:collagen alpha-1(X) chain-like isoform X2 n=1 Tax=Mytilus trossulus TaxID=6551 RepID=UPI003006A754